MFDWFNRAGYRADIPALRWDYPEVGWQTLGKARDMAPLIGLPGHAHCRLS